MDITEKSSGAVTVLDLNGRLVAGEGTQRLKDKVNSLVFQNRAQIVLNLGAVSHIDSTGLGEIVACLTTVTKGGGKLKLANVAKRNQDLLSITKLATVFETFDSEADAVRSFGAAAGA
jgi:anti-sigma B factor antagonist